MIVSFRHKGVRRFYQTGSVVGIQPKHATRLARQLAKLNAAFSEQDMNIPGWSLHALKGDRKGQWAVTVSGNWRLIFQFKNEEVQNIDYQDYH